MAEAMSDRPSLRGKTVALDFDSPLHSYTSGWTGYECEDPPSDGALEFVEGLLTRDAHLVVVSSRADCPLGVDAIERWLRLHGFPPLRVTCEKVPAVAYVDDRAVEYDPARGFDARLLDRIDDLARIAH